MVNREEARAALEAVARELGVEELLVMRYLAERLLDGQRRYGELRLGADRRDLERERSDELADALIYTAMAEVQRVVRGR